MSQGHKWLQSIIIMICRRGYNWGKPMWKCCCVMGEKAIFGVWASAQKCPGWLCKWPLKHHQAAKSYITFCDPNEILANSLILCLSHKALQSLIPCELSWMQSCGCCLVWWVTSGGVDQVKQECQQSDHPTQLHYNLPGSNTEGQRGGLRGDYLPRITLNPVRKGVIP